jgi:hypothetical protein
MRKFFSIWLLVIFSNAMAQDGYICTPVATTHVYFGLERSDYVLFQANRDNGVIRLRKNNNAWELKYATENKWRACVSVNNSKFYLDCDLESGQFKMDLLTQRYIKTFLGSYIVSLEAGPAPPSMTLGKCLND